MSLILLTLLHVNKLITRVEEIRNVNSVTYALFLPCRNVSSSDITAITVSTF